MEQLKLIPFIFLIIGVSAIIGGAVALVNSQFGDTLNKCFNTSFTFNTTTGKCLGLGANNVTGTHGSGFNFSIEYAVVYEGQQGIGTVAEQLGTIAIISVMVIIIGLISSVFVYFKYSY